MTEQTNPNPVQEEAKPNATAPDSQAETVQETNASEAATQNQEKTAPSQESFTSVDPNSLPPELRSTYENMNRDYKKKTTQVAEQRKEVELLQEKARRFDELASDETFVKYYNEKVQGSSESAAPVQDDVSEEEFSKAFESKENFKSFIKKLSVGPDTNTAEKVRVMEANNFIREFAARPGNEDFQELQKTGILTGYIQLNRPKSPGEWEKKLTEARDYARSLKARWFDEGKQAGLGRTEEKLKNSTEQPTSSPPQTYAGPDARNLSTREAIELARKGIKVPQNW